MSTPLSKLPGGGIADAGIGSCHYSHLLESDARHVWIVQEAVTWSVMVCQERGSDSNADLLKASAPCATV